MIYSYTLSLSAPVFIHYGLISFNWYEIKCQFTPKTIQYMFLTKFLILTDQHPYLLIFLFLTLFLFLEFSKNTISGEKFLEKQKFLGKRNFKSMKILGFLICRKMYFL